MAENKSTATNEHKLFFIEKKDDGEALVRLSEKELNEHPNPLVLEFCKDEEEAKKKLAEVTHARIFKTFRKRGKDAKVAKQRAEFAKANPALAAQYKMVTVPAYEKHLEQIKALNDKLPADKKIDLSKLEKAVEATRK